MHAAALEFIGRTARPPTIAALAFREIAAVFDGTDAGSNACRRAAALAADLQVPCTILFEQGVAERTHVEDLAHSLTVHVGSALPSPIRAMPCRAGLLPHARALAARHGLLVVPASDPMHARLAAKLLRRSLVRVLACRAPAGSGYARTWVAVDLNPGCERLMTAAAALAPQAGLHLVHAIDARDEIVLRELEASGRALQAFRRGRIEGARKQLGDLLAHVGAVHAPGGPLVEPGAASKVLRRLARGLAHDDLMVVGHRHRVLFPSPPFRGTLRDVLAHARADTLFLPIS